MKIEPLPKELFEKLIAAGVKKLTLEFSGGNDEGYLNVNGSPHENMSTALAGEIEDWGNNVYPYNGAGDGNDYGDNIVYDLEAMTATHQEWYTQSQYEDPSEPKAFKLA